MFNLNYDQLIKEKKVYFVMYGRGGILGVIDKSLDENQNYLKSDIYDSHSQELLVVTDLEQVDDYLVIDFKYNYNRGTDKKVLVKKKIPLYQITFESYEVVDN